MSILDILGGSIGDTIAKVVGTFHLSPAAKAEFDTAMAANALEIQKMDADLAQKELDASSGNIQAEEKSGDKYTSRARPTFMYIIELILAWNYIVVPIFNKTPVDLPTPLFWLFGSAVLGYTGARSWEKMAGAAGAVTGG